MGVTIITLEDQARAEEGRVMYTLTERTYINAERNKVVPGDSVEARFLLGNAGMRIDDAHARRLGLIPEPAVVAGESEAKALAPAEDKAMRPVDNKAMRPVSTK